MIVRKSFSQFVHEAITSSARASTSAPSTSVPRPDIITTPKPAPTSTTSTTPKPILNVGGTGAQPAPSYSTATNVKPVGTSLSSSAIRPATPAPKPSPTLDDLRSAAAKATMAGPSREAQALMSPRAKAMLGQSKLDAGIKAQQGVEAMRSSMPSSSSTPLPAANAEWAKANPKLAAAYAEKQRIRGTAQTDNPLMRDMRSSLSLTPSVQSKDVSTLGRGNQSLVQNPNAVKPLTPTTQTSPKPTAPPQPQTKPPTSGLTDAERKRIDDFKALGPLQKMQQRSTIEKELQQMTPEKRKEIMDYYNR